MKKCCKNCLYRQRIKSYDPEAAKVDPATHSRCGMDGTIHRTNKEQRGDKNFKAKEEFMK